MYPASAAFAEMLSRTHRVASSVDAYFNGVCVARDIPIVSGSVSYEEGALLRSRVSLVLAVPPALVPTAPDSPLSPYGQELRVKRGLVYGDGTDELLSLGWFRIQSSKVSEGWQQLYDGSYLTTGAEVEIEGFDRMIRIQDASFLLPTGPESLGSCVAEIKRLARGITPVSANWSVTDRAIPAAVVYEADRAKAVGDVASAMKAKAYVDRNGNLTVREVKRKSDPVVEIEIGALGTLIRWEHTLSRDEIYNAVVARGQETNQRPLVGVAIERTGPTAFDGPFLRHVLLVDDNEFVTTQKQADDAASSALARLRALRDVLVTVDTFPDPRLEVGDFVTLTLPRGSVDGRISSIELPLTAAGGAMSLGVVVSRADIWMLYKDFK